MIIYSRALQYGLWYSGITQFYPLFTNLFHKRNEPYMHLIPSQLQNITTLWQVLIFSHAKGKRLSWLGSLVTVFSVNGDWPCHWDMANFDLLQNHHPPNRLSRICHRCLCRQPLCVPNLVQIHP